MARGRSKGSMIGVTKHAIPDDRAFGTEAEIAGRDKTFAHESPTTFNQIGPEDGGTSAANMADSGSTRSGHFKFSDGV